MKIEDIKQGVSVVVADDGQEVNGYIDSYSLTPTPKINVRIIHPGHKRNGLIVAFDPDQVTLGESTPDSSVDSITKDELDGFAQEVSRRVGSFESRVGASESRISELESLVSELKTRIESLEAKATQSKPLNPFDAKAQQQSKSA